MVSFKSGEVYYSEIWAWKKSKKKKKKKRKEIEIVFFPEKNYFLKSGRVWEVLATIGYEIQEEFLRW